MIDSQISTKFVASMAMTYEMLDKYTHIQPEAKNSSLFICEANTTAYYGFHGEKQRQGLYHKR